jgi:hypothetical protein
MDKEELDLRIKNAIMLLTEGHPYKVGELTFCAQDKSHFSVTGWTINNDLKNVTRDSAVKELSQIKDLFRRMTDASNELADFIKNRTVEFNLSFDYGIGGLRICSETDGKLKWETDLS